jgi:hypothetical protein
MYFINAVVLASLWLLGFLTSYTLGGVIHVFLGIAIILVFVRVISGRNYNSNGQGN